jgi:sugar lactone lactonase YvrE
MMRLSRSEIMNFSEVSIILFIFLITAIPNIPENAVWKFNAHTVAGHLGSGRASDRLHCPKGICVDDNQNIWIADSSNHRIMKYSRGAKVGKRVAGKNMSGYRPHLLWDPSNVIFDPKTKSFIICDYHNRRVLQWFRRSETFAQVLIENIECHGLAMDDIGTLYVSDTERHEVRRYRAGDKRGTVVAGGHGQGRRLHQLNHPTYICIGPDEAIYISDSWNDRVMKWDKDAEKGVIVAGGKGKGGSLNQLDYPVGVLVDQLGTVYVADHWNNRVMRWYNGASEGNVIAGGYVPGVDANKLKSPEGLAFDRHGNLYVSDAGNHRIQRFNIRMI